MKTAIWFSLALLGCKGGEKKQPEPPPAPPPTGSAAPAPDAAAAPAPEPKVPLPREPKFGCLGWSTRDRVAACVVGENTAGEPPRYGLVFIGPGGAEPPIALAVAADGSAFEQAAIDAANAALAKRDIQPFNWPIEEAKADTIVIGKGASILWKKKQVSKGGDNRPPTIAHELVAHCKSTKTPLYTSKEEGMNPKLFVSGVEGHSVIALHEEVAREGESGVTAHALVLDIETCKLTRSGG